MILNGWILMPLGACPASLSHRNIRSKYVNSRRFMPGCTQGNNLLNIHGGCLNVKEHRASNSCTRGIRLDLSLWSKSQRDSNLQNLLTITDWICNIRTLLVDRALNHDINFSVCFIFWLFTCYDNQTVTVDLIDIHSWLQVQYVLFSALS